MLGSVVGLLYLAITRKDASTYQLTARYFSRRSGEVFTALFGQQVIHWYAQRMQPRVLRAGVAFLIGLFGMLVKHFAHF